MTIRSAADHAEVLETVALIANQPMSKVIGAVIDDQFDSRWLDPDFQEGLRSRIKRHQALLDRGEL